MQSNNRQMTGILIEGIAGSGKSTLIKHFLNEKFISDINYSFLYLNEFQTQRILDHKNKNGLLNKEDSLSILDNHINYLNKLSLYINNSEWCNPNEHQNNIFILLERFQYSHYFSYSFFDLNDLKKYENLLIDMNIKLIGLHYNKEDFKNRLIEKRCNDKNWMGYIKRLGKDDKNIIDYFENQQNKFLEAFHLSQMQKKLINTSEKSVLDSVQQMIR